jgi:pimeloyl-ACP methyl ester carboxylesterase
VERLADPAAFAAFHIVVPSLPGYGFSDGPTRPGWNIHRIAVAWAELMNRLGYSRFIALGSDWGTSISTSLALNHRQNLIGLHLIPPLVPPPAGGELTDREQASIKRLEERKSYELGLLTDPGNQAADTGILLGRTSISSDRPLGRARARRPLRRLGTTGLVHLRSSRCS